jgi:hypothetical protein
MRKESLGMFMQKYKDEGCRFVSTPSFGVDKKTSKGGLVMIKRVLVSLGCVLVLGACQSESEQTIEKPQIEKPIQVEKVSEKKDERMETASINAPVKIIHSEIVDVKEVYYDEAYQSWYVIGEGWALEATKESAENAKNGQVKVEYIIVDGEEIIHNWGRVNELGQYKF